MSGDTATTVTAPTVAVTAHTDLQFMTVSSSENNPMPLKMPSLELIDKSRKLPSMDSDLKFSCHVCVRACVCVEGGGGRDGNTNFSKSTPRCRQVDCFCSNAYSNHGTMLACIASILVLHTQRTFMTTASAGHMGAFTHAIANQTTPTEENDVVYLLMVKFVEHVATCQMWCVYVCATGMLCTREQEVESCACNRVMTQTHRSAQAFCVQS